MKKILLLCFILLNININAAIITKIINNSNQEVSFEFCENDVLLDEKCLTFPSNTTIFALSFNFPVNTEPFTSLIKHEGPGSGRRSPGFVFLRDSVPNYLKIITKLGIFYLAEGTLLYDGHLVNLAIWKQQLFKNATSNMGSMNGDLTIVINEKGEIQIFEDRLDFVLAHSAHALC